MTGPFPDTVIPPTGLTRQRMSMGLPAWAWAVVFIGTVAPIFMLGRWGLIITAASWVLGIFIAYEAHTDPKFLETWMAEMALKRVYR